MHKLLLALTLLCTTAHAGPPVIWDPGCVLGIRNLFTNTCLSSGGATSWGNITGTLADQTDLIAQFDLKQDVLAAADGSTDGYLLSVDWNTFNDKQASSGLNASKMLVTTSLGVIDTSTPMSLSADGGFNAYLVHEIPADAGNVYTSAQRFESEFDPQGNNTSQSTITGANIDTHYDRSQSGGNLLGGMSGVSSNTTHEGPGLVSNLWANNYYLGLGDGTHGGTTGNAFMQNQNISVATGHTVDSLYALNTGVNINGTVDNFTLWNVGGAFDVTNNVSADGWGFSGDIGGNYNGMFRTVTGNVGGNINLGQFQFTGDADGFQGLYINAVGNTTSYATGLSVNTSQMLVNGQPSVALNVSGLLQAGAQVEIPSSAGFHSINNINGISTIADGSPVTGTDVIANSFASLLYAGDDLAIGPSGIGWSAIGYVGQVAVATGKTVDEVNMAVAGASLPVESTGGEISTFNLYRGIGVFSAGGTATIPNMNLLKGDSNMCSGATVSCHGVNILDPLADNYFAGEANADKGFRLTTAGTQPTCDADHRGLLWNVEGGAGVADILQVCQKNAADAYIWVTK